MFLQNDTGGAAANCDSAEVWGDTHQVAFGGTLYDFQATGDFVEAQVGSNFEVQTRKVSGAPNWPNTSVNRSVATRMGNTRVAVCDGTRLVSSCGDRRRRRACLPGPLRTVGWPGSPRAGSAFLATRARLPRALAQRAITRSGGRGTLIRLEQRSAPRLPID